MVEPAIKRVGRLNLLLFTELNYYDLYPQTPSRGLRTKIIILFS